MPETCSRKDKVHISSKSWGGDMQKRDIHDKSADLGSQTSLKCKHLVVRPEWHRQMWHFKKSKNLPIRFEKWFVTSRRSILSGDKEESIQKHHMELVIWQLLCKPSAAACDSHLTLLPAIVWAGAAGPLLCSACSVDDERLVLCRWHGGRALRALTR